MTVQIQTYKRTSRTALEGGKNDGIRVFKQGGIIFRGVNGNVSFTAILFQHLNIQDIC